MQTDLFEKQDQQSVEKLNAALIDALATRIECEVDHLQKIAQIETKYKELLAAKDAVISEMEAKWKQKLAESEQMWLNELTEMETEMDRIYNSRTWALVCIVLRIRQILLPSGSIRDRLVRAVFRPAKRLYRAGRKMYSLFSAYLEKVTTEPPIEKANADKYDLFVFSVINWDFRFQRPQQMARQFAKAGHRVFYISQTFTAEKEVVARHIEKNVYELSLPANTTLNVYKDQPSETVVKDMTDSLERFCRRSKCSTGVLLVQLPFWKDIAKEMRNRFCWPMVYDCMDDHSGFTTNGESMLGNEQDLFKQSDLTLVSSDLLQQKAATRTQRLALVRNAADFDHFATVAESKKHTDRTKKRIGYYGAIADWFDTQLLADLAKLESDWEFELVGSTFSADLDCLKGCNNVKMLGEMPYDKLPDILKTWDVCIIPFRKIPLTEATNPVKVYEMLSAGMPVVSVDLPELRPISQLGLIRLADNAAEFSKQIRLTLQEQLPESVAIRQAFARKNTWADRYRDASKAIDGCFPKVSILIALHNNLELNKSCLKSILQKTDYPDYEVVLIENASTDGSREYVLDLSKKDARVKVVLNKENESFAKANNRALMASSGEYIVYLNNDTIVTEGWITKMVQHLKNDQSIGMVGPVTNAIGNEAKIDVTYTSPEGIDDFAEYYCRKNNGQLFDIPVLALFCTMIKRSLLEKIGRLDERYDVGMFEDDDLCMRIKNEGLRLVCCQDVFIHHFHQGSFKLIPPEVYKQIFENNRKRYEEKWGPWKPHQPRQQPNSRLAQLLDIKSRRKKVA